MLSHFCCCIPLRVGSFILAVMGIVGGIFCLVYSGGRPLYVSEGVWWIIADTFLLFGCIRNHRKTILVSLVFEILALIDGVFIFIFSAVNIEWAYPEFAVDCAGMTYGSENINIDCDKIKLRTLQTMVVKNCVELTLQIYFWLCNYSFYKTFQTTNENLDIRNGKTEVAKYQSGDSQNLNGPENNKTDNKDVTITVWI